jgi:hypothetical protein
VGDVRERNYRPIVEGALRDKLERASSGMTLTRVAGKRCADRHVRDHAELQGLLQRVPELGLTLLKARAINDGSERPRGAGPGNEDRR